MTNQCIFKHSDANNILSTAIAKSRGRLSEKQRIQAQKRAEKSGKESKVSREAEEEATRKAFWRFQKAGQEAKAESEETERDGCSSNSYEQG